MDSQETLKRGYLIPAESQIHNHMLIPDYQDIIFQDFRYSYGFECDQVIKIGRYEHVCFQDELDNVVEEEDEGWICFLSDNNSSRTKKYRGSNSNYGGNTVDGVKIIGGVIGSGGGIEFSKKSEEMFPDVAGK
nr:hypothetical protein [Tanacetum cinerariifolium]